VAFRSPTVDQAIELSKRQMQPEYEIMGNVERHQGGVALFLTIMEANR
jgi:hypothetical protein